MLFLNYQLISKTTEYNWSSKLLLSLVSVQLAQNIALDHHAATEELYYYMKKNRDTDTSIYEFINNISKMNNNGSYS